MNYDPAVTMKPLSVLIQTKPNPNFVKSYSNEITKRLNHRAAKKSSPAALCLLQTNSAQIHSHTHDKNHFIILLHSSHNIMIYCSSRKPQEIPKSSLTTTEPSPLFFSALRLPKTSWIQTLTKTHLNKQRKWMKIEASMMNKFDQEFEEILIEESNLKEKEK